MYYICFEYDKSVNPADHSVLDLDPTSRMWWKEAVAKGFSVVAEEVRNLAYKTGEESKKTDEIVRSCILAIEKAKKATADTYSILEGVYGESEETRTAFHSIYEDISALALSATEMVKEIDNVSNAVQANMATTEQTAAASVELSVKRFLHMLFIKFAEIKL